MSKLILWFKRWRIKRDISQEPFLHRFKRFLEEQETEENKNYLRRKYFLSK